VPLFQRTREYSKVALVLTSCRTGPRRSVSRTRSGASVDRIGQRPPNRLRICFLDWQTAQRSVYPFPPERTKRTADGRSSACQWIGQRRAPLRLQIRAVAFVCFIRRGSSGGPRCPHLLTGCGCLGSGTFFCEQSIPIRDVLPTRISFRVSEHLAFAVWRTLSAYLCTVRKPEYRRYQERHTGTVPVRHAKSRTCLTPRLKSLALLVFTSTGSVVRGC
jgi:hypothetical protein